MDPIRTACLICGFAFGLCLGHFGGSVLMQKHMEQQAVEHDSGRYNPENGRFEWFARYPTTPDGAPIIERDGPA